MSAFFDIIHQDPVLSMVKLIAEPWDLGDGGYQVGNFPLLWTEWNGRYRDTVRQFWTGAKNTVGEMGFRLTGSSDLYEDDGRRPHASINFVTAHDGFTLRDLVTYEKKRNLDNGEENRDGWDDNKGWNCGVEGETDDPRIRQLRARQIRNYIVTMMVSQGVPMITAGDEMGKTQRGNNNAFVQDNETSWIDWDLDVARTELLSFARDVIAFRHRHPVFRRPRFLRGARVGGSDLPDIAWFRPDGKEMTPPDWQDPPRATLGLLLTGDTLDWRDAHGDAVVDDSFLVLLNGAREPVEFTLPGFEWGSRWALCIDTTHDVMDPPPESASLGTDAAARLTLEAESVMVFQRTLPRRGSLRPTRLTRGGF
jgi:glycogen operon protein